MGIMTAGVTEARSRRCVRHLLVVVDVHGVELAGGKANWYRNRYVRTPVFNNPDKTRMEMYLDPETFAFNYDVGTANTHVIGHHGRIFALEEGSFPFELSREIDTVGPCTFDSKLATAVRTQAGNLKVIGWVEGR